MIESQQRQQTRTIARIVSAVSSIYEMMGQSTHLIPCQTGNQHQAEGTKIGHVSKRLSLLFGFYK